MRRRILFAVAAVLTAAAPLSTAAVLIFGEQHDQPDQQRQVADEVRQRAAAGTLAAVVLEMADRGRDTRGVPPDASEAQVREALGWNGWPWEPYAAVVMNAVRARVPVHGGNLPRSATRDAMRDESLDAQVADGVRTLLAREVRERARAVLGSAQAARFFAPGLRWAGNEVPVADAGGVARIDRLVCLERDGAPEWWVLDYKLAHAPAEVDAHRAQLARYRAAVQALQPGERVRAAFVTGRGDVVEV